MLKHRNSFLIFSVMIQSFSGYIRFENWACALKDPGYRWRAKKIGSNNKIDFFSTALITIEVLIDDFESLFIFNVKVPSV